MESINDIIYENNILYILTSMYKEMSKCGQEFEGSYY